MAEDQSVVAGGVSHGRHTLGRWAVSKNSTGRRVTTTTGVVICNAVLRNGGTAKGGHKHGAKAEQEAQANACLIAAAPSMLEALQALLHQALQSELTTEHWGQEAISLARAAILAATTPTTSENGK